VASGEEVCGDAQLGEIPATLELSHWLTIYQPQRSARRDGADSQQIG
jgi:hypothetical protein